MWHDLLHYLLRKVGYNVYSRFIGPVKTKCVAIQMKAIDVFVHLMK